MPNQTLLTTLQELKERADYRRSLSPNDHYLRITADWLGELTVNAGTTDREGFKALYLEKLASASTQLANATFQTHDRARDRVYALTHVYSQIKQHLD
jgi:uncharacterized protein Smg (DUF494 family)